MADTKGSVKGTFDPNATDGGSIGTVNDARKGELPACKRIVGNPTFAIEAETDTASGAEAYFDLSDLGVTFPADTVRPVKVTTIVRDDTAASMVEQTFLVVGGANPTLSADNLASANTVGGLGTTTTPLNPAAVVAINTTPDPDTVEVQFDNGDLAAGATYKVVVEVEVEPLRVIGAGSTAT